MLLIVGRDQKNYLKAFSGFYLVFTVIIFLNFLRSYFMLNISWTSAYSVYVSHGVTTVLNYLLLFYGMKTVHKLLQLKRAVSEKIWAFVLLLSALLLISPLSIVYIESIETISFKGSYFLATIPYLGLFGYMLFFIIFYFKRIKKIEDKLFGIFLGTLSLSGFVETILSFIGDIKNPFLEMNISGDGIIISSIPYLALSIYVIIFLIKKFVGKGSIPDSDTLVTLGYSQRESDVLILIIKGYPNRKIADELCISMATVKTHINNIFKKSDVSNRFELAKKLENL